MKTNFLIPILFSGALTASVLFAAVVEVPDITEENAATFYKLPSFTRLTKQPLYVAPLTASLCVNPGPDMMAQEMAQTGPHYKARIHIYGNRPVLDAIRKKAEVYPENSVIIKEKLDDKGEMKAVGGMIKRQKGYDPENGNWEYFYFSKGGNFASGKMQNCIDCHRAPETVDHVFSLWKIGEFLLSPGNRPSGE